MPTRAEMIQEQLRARGIGDERVLAAMEAIPRQAFVAAEWAHSAHDDRALPIGHGQTLSQPWIVAAICEALELEGDERVLEVGTGSGYSAAVLARLCSRILSIELIPQLARTAAMRLRDLGIANVEVRIGDGGAETGVGEFDAIAVHAAAPSLPRALVRALRPGGRLVAPIASGEGGEMLRAYRHTGFGGDGAIQLEATDISPARFVPLRGEAGFESG